MTRNVVVIDVTLNGQNSSCQQGIIEMLSNFMCCMDRESDQAARILKKAKRTVVCMPGVESVAEGKGKEARNILTVTGEEIDPVRLVQLLEKKGCFAKLKKFEPEPPAPAPAPVPTPPIFCHHSPHWHIVEIREPTSCFNF